MSLVHLHLLTNHIPVIGLPFAAVVLIAALSMRNSNVGKLGLLMLIGVAALSAIPYYTGESAVEAVKNLAGVTREATHEHEEAAEFAFIATCVMGTLGLALLWVYRKRDLPRWTVGVSLTLALFASSILARTAYLGGQIRHTEIHASAPADSTVAR